MLWFSDCILYSVHRLSFAAFCATCSWHFGSSTLPVYQYVFISLSLCLSQASLSRWHIHSLEHSCIKICGLVPESLTHLCILLFISTTLSTDDFHLPVNQKICLLFALNLFSDSISDLQTSFTCLPWSQPTHILLTLTLGLYRVKCNILVQPIDALFGHFFIKTALHSFKFLRKLHIFMLRIEWLKAVTCLTVCL